MTKRPASSAIDALTGSSAHNGASESWSRDDLANELPSWFETFVKSNDDRDRLMKEVMYENQHLKLNIEYLNTEIYDDPDFVATKTRAVKAEKGSFVARNVSESVVATPMHSLLSSFVLKSTKPKVLVLIDGNKCMFRPEFIEQGSSGGVEAAQCLNDEIVQCISNSHSAGIDCEIALRVYVDVGWLLWKFPVLELDKKALRPFIQGFNQHPLFVMADVSSTFIYGKIRGDLKSSINYNHILLGDDTTDTDLQLLKRTNSTSPLLTLIQPFQPQSPPKPSSNIVTFPSIFIAEDPPSIDGTTPTPTIRQPAPPSSPPSKPPPPPPPPPPPLSDISSTTTPRPLFPAPILLNTHSQRIDPPLPTPGSAGWAYINRIQSHPEEKLCNDHHLLGHCPLGSDCNFSHRDVENDVRMAMMRGMRGIPCRQGSACRNRNCVLGHVCPYPRCGERGRVCRFGEEAHGVEEGGVREWFG